jgi:hypothetical protein
VSEPQPEEEGIGELLTRLAEDAKLLGEAEIDYYRTLARGKLHDAREGLWLGAAAIGLAMAASIALVVGLVLTLTPALGPGLATLVVVVVIGGWAAVMGWLAWRHVKRVFGGTK